MVALYHQQRRIIVNPENKETLRAHICEQISSTKNDIQSFQALSQPVSPDNAIGRLTRMEAINSKSINEAALKKAQQTLLRMERALAMIDAPDFGLCQECEEPIPFARLMIVPESDLCVQCAEALEE